MKSLYMDNAATTKVLRVVADSMNKYLTEIYGNPNSKYYWQAEKSNEAFIEARNKISDIFKCQSDEIIFTSGSTESNNLVLKGIVDANLDKGNHIIISAVEHSSIMNTAKFLESKGIEVTYLEVEKNGSVNPEVLKKNIKNNTIMISIMWANNEFGTINDIEILSSIAKDNNIYFHTDATQVIGKLKIDLDKLKDIDFLSASAHKFYGPKGIGLLFIRRDKYGTLPPITPLIHGGEQQFNIRSGTIPVHLIVGMEKAFEVVTKDLDRNRKILLETEKELMERLKKVFNDKVIFNNLNINKIPGLLSVRLLGINNQVFLKKVSSVFSASTGSACSNMNPSHVLKAMGFSDKEIRETIRFSLSAYEDYDNFESIE